MSKDFIGNINTLTIALTINRETNDREPLKFKQYF